MSVGYLKNNHSRGIYGSLANSQQVLPGAKVAIKAQALRDLVG
jgi:hypothetical protein